jgi:hypothetical protein
MCDRCGDARCNDPDSKWCSDILLMRYKARIAALEAEREELLGLLFRASEWLVPDEHSPENMDKLACEINAAIDAAKEKP